MALFCRLRVYSEKCWFSVDDSVIKQAIRLLRASVFSYVLGVCLTKR